MQEICKGYSDAYNANIELDYNYGYPATINYKKEKDFAVKVAKEITGDNNVEDDAKPDMGAEDFSFMLQRGQSFSQSWTRKRSRSSQYKI